MSTIPPAIEAAAKEAERVKAELLGTPPPPATPTPPPDPVATLQADVAALEQKKDRLTKDINTLNGTYGSNLQKLKTQLADADRRIFALQKENDQLKNELAAAKDAPAKPAEADDDRLRQEYGEQFIEEYGVELAKTFEKQLAARTKHLTDQLAILSARLDGQAPPPPTPENDEQATAEKVDMFWSLVEQHVPGARAMNEQDPGWLMFLNEADPETGTPRIEEGQSAIVRGDIPAVVALFQAYIKDRDEKAGSGGSKPTARPDAHIDPPSVRAGSGSPAPGAELSQADWDAFIAEVRNQPGKYSPAEVTKINKQFTDALLAGRLKL